MTIKDGPYFNVDVDDENGIECDIEAFGDAASLARDIWNDFGDEEEVVPRERMVRYFPGRPEMHTETRLYTALMAAGCEHSR